MKDVIALSSDSSALSVKTNVWSRHTQGNRSASGTESIAPRTSVVLWFHSSVNRRKRLESEELLTSRKIPPTMLSYEPFHQSY